MRNVVIYCSENTQAAAADLRAQEEIVRVFLSKLGINHRDAVVIDQAASDADAERIGIQKLDELANAGAVGVLGIADLTRLARLNADATVKKIIASGGRIISVAEGDVTPCTVRIQASPYISAALRGSRVRITTFLRRPPFGYRPVASRDAGQGRATQLPYPIVEDEREGPIVRLIFRRYGLDRCSASAIVRELSTGAIPTPRRARGGWSHAAVRWVLKNAKYHGHWSRSTARAENRDDVVPAPPLVETSLWDLVQQRLASRRRGRRARPHS